MHRQLLINNDAVPKAVMKSKEFIDQSLNDVAQFAIINPVWMLQAFIFLMCALYEMLNTYQSLVSEGATVEYAVARSCGAVLKLLMAAILIPLARVSYTRLQNSDVGRYLGLDHQVMDHKIFATGISAFSAMHAVAHYYHDPRNYIRLPGITGVTMLATLALPISGAYLFRQQTQKVVKGSYETTVMNPHRIGAAAFLIAYAMHTPDWRLMKYAVVSCLPLGIDRIVERLYFRHMTTICDARLIPDTDYMQLKIDRPNTFTRFNPGQYVLLSTPTLEELFEFSHPFTLVNDNGRQLELLIKNTGPWTNKLYKWIEGAGEHTHMPAIVTGPFGSALIDSESKHGLTMVGTGIGMTPALAVLHAIASDIIEVHNLKLHIAARQSSEFEPVIDVLSQAVSAKPDTVKQVDFYVTGTQPVNFAASNLTFFSHSSDASRRTTRSMTDPDRLSVTVHRGRPDLFAIAQQSSAMSVCGNPQIVKEADKVTRRLGVRCHLESF